MQQTTACSTAEAMTKGKGCSDACGIVTVPVAQTLAAGKIVRPCVNRAYEEHAAYDQQHREQEWERACLFRAAAVAQA